MTTRKEHPRQPLKVAPDIPVSSELVRRLSELPFEDRVGHVLNTIGASIELSGVMDRFESIRGRLPYVPSTIVPSPFGAVELPALELPEAKLPAIDARRRQALKAAVGIDLSFLLAQIPLLGDALADIIEDIYLDRIRGLLTPEEFATFTKYDKIGPSTIAMIRTWAV